MFLSMPLTSPLDGEEDGEEDGGGNLGPVLTGLELHAPGP